MPPESKPLVQAILRASALLHPARATRLCMGGIRLGLREVGWVHVFFFGFFSHRAHL